MAKRILTVDDSKTIREMVGLTLRGAGFEVLGAEDGVQALAVLDKAAVDLVITDIIMPNMDGVALVRELRSKPRHRSTPILILTTESDDERKAEGRAAGATGWILKPYTSDKLLQVIGKVCPH